MKLPVNRLEPLLIDVGVNLSRRDIRVPQHLLDNPKVSAIPQKMGGETVSKEMRINILFQAGLSGPGLYDLPNSSAR